MSRATLKPIVSKLREAIIKGVAGKLEKQIKDKNYITLIESCITNYLINTEVLYYGTYFI